MTDTVNLYDAKTNLSRSHDVLWIAIDCQAK